eukprot:CAMPEP_0119323762 /NCGR_PEP_ID=MMETSP1333-20130426/61547_1 /TAXON_ID=418940 /ORGANISM="Scyphosphaera apsteinii, Strain RCC1455" /LENGTH=221 /DNA_ID=CAMNT_0007331295 /DNA_START=157 /DNA_END=820 /DNA_ORIENTATION=-
MHVTAAREPPSLTPARPLPSGYCMQRSLLTELLPAVKETIERENLPAVPEVPSPTWDSLLRLAVAADHAWADPAMLVKTCSMAHGSSCCSNTGGAARLIHRPIVCHAMHPDLQCEVARWQPGGVFERQSEVLRSRAVWKGLGVSRTECAEPGRVEERHHFDLACPDTHCALLLKLGDARTTHNRIVHGDPFAGARLSTIECGERHLRDCERHPGEHLDETG